MTPEQREEQENAKRFIQICCFGVFEWSWKEYKRFLFANEMYFCTVRINGPVLSLHLIT